MVNAADGEHLQAFVRGTRSARVSDQVLIAATDASIASQARKLGVGAFVLG